MGKKLNVAVVQFKMTMEDYRDRLSFQTRINSIMYGIVSKIDRSVPLLAAFPEDIGTPILLFDSLNYLKDKDSFAQAVQVLLVKNFLPALRCKLRFGVSLIRSLLLSKGAAMESEYKLAFSQAAKRYNAYIAAGSITLPEINERDGEKHITSGDVYNMSYFFGPDGELIGRQKKVNLVDFEGKSGFDLSNGSLNELQAFETPFGSVGIAICLDAFKDPVCSNLSEKGVDILVQPSANNGIWNEWQQGDWLNGSYLSTYIRKKFKYALNPMMNGSILDLHFEGQSSIISSMDTGYEGNYYSLKPVKGFVQLASGYDDEEVLISQIEV